MSFECLATCEQRVLLAGGDFKESCTPVSQQELADFQVQLAEETGLILPPGLRQFWEEKGDEYVAWIKVGEETAIWEWTPIREIIGDYLNDRRVAQEKLRFRIERGEATDEFHAQIERMRTWLPFLRLSDGPLVVDSETGEVLFQSFHWDLDDPSLWLRRMAPSLERFVEAWSKYAFMDPMSGFDHPFEWQSEYFPITL